MTLDAPPGALDLQRVIAEAEAENAAPDARPLFADRVEVAYKSYEIGLSELSRDDYAGARSWLQTAVDYGIEDARPLLALCQETVTVAMGSGKTHALLAAQFGVAPEATSALDQEPTPLYWEVAAELSEDARPEKEVHVEVPELRPAPRPWQSHTTLSSNDLVHPIRFLPSGPGPEMMTALETLKAASLRLQALPEYAAALREAARLVLPDHVEEVMPASLRLPAAPDICCVLSDNAADRLHFIVATVARTWRVQCDAPPQSNSVLARHGRRASTSSTDTQRAVSRLLNEWLAAIPRDALVVAEDLDILRTLRRSRPEGGSETENELAMHLYQMFRRHGRLYSTMAPPRETGGATADRMLGNASISAYSLRLVYSEAYPDLADEADAAGRVS